MGSCSLGLEVAREAQRLEPLYLYGPIFQSAMHFCLGRTDEALLEIRRTLAVEPDMGYALILQVEFLADLGRLEEAAEVLQMLETQVSQGRLPEFLVLNSRIMIALEHGDMAAAAAPLARILELVNDPSTAAFPLQMFVLHLVPFLARHAQTDTVLQILTRAVEAGVIPPHGLVDPQSTVGVDPRRRSLCRHHDRCSVTIRRPSGDSRRCAESRRVRGVLGSALGHSAGRSRDVTRVGLTVLNMALAPGTKLGVSEVTA